jgi:opacity protein-like surface antigen
MNRLLSLGLAVLLLAACAMAQSGDHGEVFGGYSYINKDFTLTLPTGGLTGWNASVTFKVVRHVGIVTDFSGYYPGYTYGCVGCGQSAKVFSFLFGPQASFTVGRVTPFARFLFGDSHVHTAADGIANLNTFTSNNSFTYGAGGGADVRLTRRLALRGQVDWLHNRFQTVDDQRTQFQIPNVARISTGIVFRF